VREDRLLQLLQLPAWVDPELLDERPPRVLVDGQRVRLPAGAVEREHQLCPQTLMQRVLLHQCLELVQDFRMPAERQLRVDQVHGGAETLLLQPSDLVPRERLEHDVGERRAAPERECLAEALGCSMVIARCG
jgi:hypothetical protein